MMSTITDAGRYENVIAVVGVVWVGAPPAEPRPLTKHDGADPNATGNVTVQPVVFPFVSVKARLPPVVIDEPVPHPLTVAAVPFALTPPTTASEDELVESNADAPAITSQPVPVVV